MGCAICGGIGGFECPTCACDFCERHFKERVKQDRNRKYDIVNDKCQRCGEEL